MPDDPDDFLRQLQILASAAGGDPSAATIMVNGFQNGSALPPKSSIAAIRVNPDMFSSEYRWPPFSGGAIEIVTKPAPTPSTEHSSSPTATASSTQPIPSPSPPLRQASGVTDSN